MTLAELRYLVVLAQERHFGRAARQCCVSQPALSIAIKKLEQELGVALFLRERSNITITPVGEDIIAQARRVLESAEAIRAIAETDSSHLAGPLAVGAICTAAPYLLPQCAARLLEAPAPLDLNIEQAPVDVLRRRLCSGELDAIIVSQPFEEPDVVCQTLFDEPLVVLLPATHPLAAKTTIKPAELGQQKLLMLTREHCLHHQVLAALPLQLDGATRHDRTTHSLETLRNLVAHGMGLAVIPLCATSSLCTGTGNLTTRPFTEPVPQRRLALAWRASFPRHRAIDQLRQALQSCNAAHGWYIAGDTATRRGLLVDNSHW